MTKIAVVTGGNRGIGLEICRQLANRGIHVILSARDDVVGQEASKNLSTEGLSVEFQNLDVTDLESIGALAATISESFGQLDILVNNAGIYIDRGQSPLNVDAAVVRKTLDTNFIGPLVLCQRLIPIMRRNRFGRIVNVSSQMGSLNDMGTGGLAYRTSKSALNAMTRVLANELAGTNILVNAVDPGWVRTDMGGSGASRSVSEGADTAVWLATLPDGGPTGGFFRDKRPRSW